MLAPYFTDLHVYTSPKLPVINSSGAPPQPCEDEHCARVVFWSNTSKSFARVMSITEPTLIVYRSDGERLAQVGPYYNALERLVLLDNTKVEVAIEHGNFSGALDSEWTPELQAEWEDAKRQKFKMEQKSLMSKLFSFRI